jgi:hypothetical protein
VVKVAVIVGDSVGVEVGRATRVKSPPVVTPEATKKVTVVD